MKYTAEQRAAKIKFRLLALKHLNHLKDDLKPDPHTWTDEDEDLKRARAYLIQSEAINPMLVSQKEVRKKINNEKLDSKNRVILEGLIKGMPPTQISKYNHIPLEEIYHVATVENMEITPMFLWRLVSDDVAKKSIYFNDRRILRKILDPKPGERLTDQSVRRRGYILESGRFDWNLINIGDCYALSFKDGVRVKNEEKFTA